MNNEISEVKSRRKIVDFFKESMVLSIFLLIIYGVLLFEVIYPLNSSYLFSLSLPVVGILFIDFFIKFGSMAILCLILFPLLIRKLRSELDINLNPFKKKDKMEQIQHRTKPFFLGTTCFLIQLISFLVFGFIFGTLSINFNPLLDQPYISSEIPIGWFLFVLALLPGIFEELLFREYIFRLQITKYSSKFTIISNGVLFSIFHIFGRINDPFTEIIVMLFVSLPYGIALAYLRLSSNSVIPCIVIHYLTDSLFLFLLYGLFSFEGDGSGLLLVFILGVTIMPSILIAIFLSTYAKKNQTNIL